MGIVTFVAIAWSWLVGWGGVGVAACIVAWAAWFFVPVFKIQLLQIAIAVTVFTVASTYFYSRGYEAALAAVAREDADAIARVAAGAVDVQACRARGGTWDVTTGACR